MPDLVLQWKKPQKGEDVVSRVDPGTSVKLESLVAGAQDKTATVYHVPEPFIRRLLYKVRRRIGVPHTALVFNAEGASGPISQGWVADQLPPEQKPTKFVAGLSGIGISGPLTVTRAVDFQWIRELEAGFSIDGAALAALGGPPVPMSLKAGSNRRIVTQGKAYGVNDPSVALRLLSTGSDAEPLVGFLEEYLAVIDEIFESEPGALWKVLRSEFRDCLEEPGQFIMEAEPDHFDIDEDEEIDVALRIEARSPGRALAGVGVFDIERNEPITISDLVVLGADEDGSMFIGY